MIRFADGRELSEELAVADSHPRGAAPWGYDDYRRKFAELTAGFVAEGEGAAFLAAARDLGALDAAALHGLGLAADLCPPVAGPTGLWDRA